MNALNEPAYADDDDAQYVSLNQLLDQVTVASRVPSAVSNGRQLSRSYSVRPLSGVPVRDDSAKDATLARQLVRQQSRLGSRSFTTGRSGRTASGRPGRTVSGRPSPTVERRARCCGAGTAVGGAVHYVSYQLKVLVQTCRSKPHTLLMPTLLFLLLSGCGLFGTLFTAHRSTRQAQDYARQAVAVPVAAAILGQLSVATMAASALTSYVMQHPACADLDQHFAGLGRSILDMDAEGSGLQLVYQVQAYPAMVLSYSYPPPPQAQAPQPGGADLLASADTRSQALAQLQHSNSTLVLGPFATPQGFKALSVVRHLVLPVPYMEYDWGCGRQLTNCSGEEGPCLFKQRGYKLWGRVTSTVSLDNLQAAFGLDSLADTYRFKLSQLPTAFSRAEVIAASDVAPLLPVAVSVSSLNLRWVLQVEPFAGWEPYWRGPCVAAVILASAAVSLLVLWLLVSRERHDMLLCSMLPKRVIKQLHSGRNVVENFPAPVTVLFSDIVSYCEVASQLTPLQVVELLNDLYTVFDSLTVTHGCYKVETIGDCFVATAGCPNHEDPVSAAVRVAGMAQAMIHSVSNFNSSVTDRHGIKLKIRIGLHSGPVVAGVVGLQMPRYCLFGDTVNIASRMESNSAPMCIHISASTAALLMQAGAAVLPVGLKPERRSLPGNGAPNGAAAGANIVVAYSADGFCGPGPSLGSVGLSPDPDRSVRGGRGFAGASVDADRSVRGGRGFPAAADLDKRERSVRGGRNFTAADVDRGDRSIRGGRAGAAAAADGERSVRGGRANAGALYDASVHTGHRTGRRGLAAFFFSSGSGVGPVESGAAPAASGARVAPAPAPAEAAAEAVSAVSFSPNVQFGKDAAQPTPMPQPVQRGASLQGPRAVAESVQPEQPEPPQQQQQQQQQQAPRQQQQHTAPQQAQQQQPSPPLTPSSASVRQQQLPPQPAPAQPRSKSLMLLQEQSPQQMLLQSPMSLKLLREQQPLAPGAMQTPKSLMFLQDASQHQRQQQQLLISPKSFMVPSTATAHERPPQPQLGAAPKGLLSSQRSRRSSGIGGWTDGDASTPARSSGGSRSVRRGAAFVGAADPQSGASGAAAGAGGGVSVSVDLGGAAWWGGGKAEGGAPAKAALSGANLVLQDRGEIVIKGKGVMHTYWLLTGLAPPPLPPPPPRLPPPPPPAVGEEPMPSRRTTATGAWQWPARPPSWVGRLTASGFHRAPIVPKSDGPSSMPSGCADGEAGRLPAVV